MTPEIIQKECLNLLVRFATMEPNRGDFFDTPVSLEEAEQNALVYLSSFNERWIALTKAMEIGHEDIADDFLLEMLHSIETSKPITFSDSERLKYVCFEIKHSKEPMQGAFKDIIDS